MTTQALWSHPVYDPVATDVHGDPGKPYRFLITELLPFDGGCTLRWQAVEGAEGYLVRCRPHGASAASDTVAPVWSASTEARLMGLQNLRDYEVWVEARRGETSLGLCLSRWVRPHAAAFPVVSYLHPDDYAYAYSGRSLATPSLLSLPDGTLLCSHDVYWQDAGQSLTRVFASRDGGLTWRLRCDLTPCFWGKLFEHQGSVYMLACATAGGPLMIGRSEDQGHTFSAPVTLYPHAGRSALPVVAHQGRLWTSMDAKGGTVVASVDAQGDLLDPASWTFSAPLLYDPQWPGVATGNARQGFGEGNMVVGPDGALYDILRYETRGATPGYGLAGMLRIDTGNPQAAPSFARILRFEGNLSKFSIARHAQSGLYFAAVNRVVDEPTYYRGRLTLMRSRDLVAWTPVRDLLDAQEIDPQEWPTHVAFQYPDMLFQGNTLCLLSRTALFGAYNYHNANMITFHRFDLSAEVADA